VIALQKISKIYDLGAVKIEALRQVDLSIERGEFLTIMGPSGSGKSTLLHILGMLDDATSGSYALEGHEVRGLPDRDVARIRNEHFGFIFQSFNLFPDYSALENVTMPLIYAGVPQRQREEKAAALLERVGLTDRMHHFPSQLSGGEQQRVAIARALANDPSLILADEPTGNLPSDMGMEILSLLCALNDEGATLVAVAHDERIGTVGTRRLRLKDGRIAAQETVTERIRPQEGSGDELTAQGAPTLSPRSSGPARTKQTLQGTASGLDIRLYVPFSLPTIDLILLCTSSTAGSESGPSFVHTRMAKSFAGAIQTRAK
jgi:putative ABC transport system ATP-binding protein